jgi:hypothetical protein
MEPNKSRVRWLHFPKGVSEKRAVIQRSHFAANPMRFDPYQPQIRKQKTLLLYFQDLRTRQDYRSSVQLVETTFLSPRAARRLRISQPMLTKNIQDVEALVGGPLFLRDRKHVVLSDAGRAYVQHGRLSLLYANGPSNLRER